MKKTIVIDEDVWLKLCDFCGQRMIDTSRDFKLSRAINELLRKSLDNFKLDTKAHSRLLEVAQTSKNKVTYDKAYKQLANLGLTYAQIEEKLKGGKYHGRKDNGGACRSW